MVGSSPAMTLRRESVSAVVGITRLIWRKSPVWNAPIFVLRRTVVRWALALLIGLVVGEAPIGVPIPRALLWMIAQRPIATLPSHGAMENRIPKAVVRGGCPQRLSAHRGRLAEGVDCWEADMTLNNGPLAVMGGSPHSSPHFATAMAGVNTPAFDTAAANSCINGRRRCLGMLGMSS